MKVVKGFQLITTLTRNPIGQILARPFANFQANKDKFKYFNKEKQKKFNLMVD